MYLYNSATHKKEEFKTHTPNHVEMYTCGPTVYHFAHIGNLRSYIMEDVLEKYLRFSGYSVNRVMNITDVGHLTSDADEGEDKMVKGARREHKTVMEIAKFYTDAFFADCKKLNIKRPDVVQPATGLIDDYIKIITKLLDTGYAYIAGGNVYFDTSKLSRYYIFNDHNEEDLAVGVREGVEEDENKKNKNDFVLWFTKSKFEDQALKWDSPWGVGYPGWHIECSGISMKYNGEYLDLHCGGVDEAVRAEYRAKFMKEMDNDLNTAMGVTALYDVLKAKTTGATKLAIIGDYDTVLSLDLLKKAEAERETKEKAAAQQSAGGFTVVSEDGTADESIENLIRQRAEAKKAKNFAEADRIRDELKAQGIEVTDMPGGAKWKRV